MSNKKTRNPKRLPSDTTDDSTAVPYTQRLRSAAKASGKETEKKEDGPTASTSSAVSSGLTPAVKRKRATKKKHETKGKPKTDKKENPSKYVSATSPVQKNCNQNETIENSHKKDMAIDNGKFEIKKCSHCGKESKVKNPMVTDSMDTICGMKVSFMFPGLKKQNLLSAIQQTTLGYRPYQNFHECMSNVVCSSVRTMKLLRTGSPFDRRVTALQWHPYKPSLIAVGAKSGDIILWDVEKANFKEIFIKGIGAGGSIQAMKFWPNDYNKLLTASIDGTITKYDLQTGNRQMMLDTLNCVTHWFCSVDVSKHRQVFCTGANNGMCRMISMDGEPIWSNRLHKNKTTNIHFNHVNENLLCTSSTDHTVKLWDLRMMKDEKNPLAVLKHDKAVNSAYFSLTDGLRVLTTDQYNEIRIYNAPHWDLEKLIIHPHRFYQHLTPIKAQWHPYKDIFVVGRYPDTASPRFKLTERRTIDIYSTACSNWADDGVIEPNAFIYDPHTTGIISLNQFNGLGNMLASGMGFNILIWKNDEQLHETQTKLMNEMIEAGMSAQAAYARSAVSSARAARMGTSTAVEGHDSNPNTPQKRIRLNNTSNNPSTRQKQRKSDTDTVQKKMSRKEKKK